MEPPYTSSSRVSRLNPPQYALLSGDRSREQGRRTQEPKDGPDRLGSSSATGSALSSQRGANLLGAQAIGKPVDPH
jgi:hypothetical protein